MRTLLIIDRALVLCLAALLAYTLAGLESVMRGENPPTWKELWDMVAGDDAINY